jgi:GNAT superfamily N-acetyltransferase
MTVFEMQVDAGVRYVVADDAWRQRIAVEWGETAARHVHVDDGFSILALCDGKAVGLISVYWKALPPPLPGTDEGYVDIIEVREGFRRRGIAARMIEMSVERARVRGVYQLRAWSSEDKIEAISMWKALGFGLCPATTYPGGQEIEGYFVTKVL